MSQVTESGIDRFDSETKEYTCHYCGKIYHNVLRLRSHQGGCKERARYKVEQQYGCPLRVYNRFFLCTPLKANARRYLKTNMLGYDKLEGRRAEEKAILVMACLTLLKNMQYYTYKEVTVEEFIAATNIPGQEPLVIK